MLGFFFSTGHGLSGPLYRVDQVPENFQEVFIVRGYRHPKSSFKQCILSLFDATNETMNFWTHFLPMWYFIWVFYQLSYSFDFRSDPYTWPLLCYLVVCCFVPMASATAHLFNVMSDEARHIWFFFDYSALSLLSCGVAIAYRAYVFPLQLLSDDGPYVWIRDNFVCIAIFNAVLCICMTCLSRFIKSTLIRKILRLGGFAYPFVFDTLPLIYRVVYCSEQDCQLGSQYFHLRGFFMVFLSAVLFASHLPERLLPGSFDIVGHSHQLFHITSMLGMNDQLQGILLDVEERKDFVQTKMDFTSISNSIGTMLFVVAANILIIAFYSFRLFRQRPHSKIS